MREIKFRAKDNETAEWRYGQYAYLCYYPDSEYTHRIGGWLIDAETLSEFTNEYDNKGINICGNDFIKSDLDDIYLISFENGSWMAVHSPTCGDEVEGECKRDYLHSFLKSVSCVIVGNMTDDRNLLTA